MAQRTPKQAYKLLFTKSIKIGDKLIYVDVIENFRGRALRIAELVNGTRQQVMLPKDIADVFGNDVMDALTVLTKPEESDEPVNHQAK